MGAILHSSNAFVENDAEATFNIDDIVYPASFSMSLNLSGHNIVAGTMTKKDYEKIQDDPNVKVEIDHEVHVLEEDHDTNLRRKLSENTPYGISMVLQDMDFWS